MAEKVNKITVGLIKQELEIFSEIVKPDLKSIKIDGVGVFYAKDSPIKTPGWISKFFGRALDGKIRLASAIAQGVLLVKYPDGDNERIFAILFGHGRNLLQADVLEERFGLRVVLNSVDPESLRSIDKVALGSIPKQSREQISREGEASNFGIDIEQDLINSVTGRSREEYSEFFGKTISGKDTFSASAKFDVENIFDFISVVVERYKSEDYKERFDWVDHVKEIRSKKDIDNLNSILIEKLNSGEFDKIWLVPPEIIDWSDVGNFFYEKNVGKTYRDLEILDLIGSADGGEITLAWLKSNSIFLNSSSDENVKYRWTSYKCIYAEVESCEGMCVLNAGKWYRVASDFTCLVNSDYEKIPECNIELPEFKHNNENSYNKEVSKKLIGSCCLDGELVIHGGGYSKIEFCDILTKDCKLLHVKRYGGSSHLSHLFSQGVVSADLFLNDAEFREKLNDILPDSHKLANPNDRPDSKKYEIVYVIISKYGDQLDIPFFSKVTLRNARRRLSGFGYTVSIKRVLSVDSDN